jgi:hypothetical protein
MAFSVTVNTVEEQTLKHAGIYLPWPLFSRGHLYVAFYLASSFYVTQAIMQNARKRTESDILSTPNFVYREVLVSFKNINTFL